MPISRRRFLLQATAPLFTSSLHASPIVAQTPLNAFPGLIVRQTEPENLEFPFSSLRDSIIPNEQFFVRCHFPIPKLDVRQWKLTVEGAVKKKLEIGYDELLSLPSKSLTATIECAGNNRVALTPATNGLQWGNGAVGNAEWTGVSLATLLDKAGVNDDAVEVILEGADRGQINSDPKSPGPIHFARSLPMAKARHPATLLCFKMNGQPLPEAHGFPLRAVVSGWYGMASVKWLSRIIVTEKRYEGFFQTLDYSFWERRNELPTLVPVTSMQVKAAIAQPALGSIMAAGKERTISGAAWAGEAAVARVDVSTDGGKTWNVAKLIDKPVPFTWARWEYNWEVPQQPGPARLMARATDSDGRVQPMERDGDRRNYMISHVLPVDVEIR